MIGPRLLVVNLRSLCPLTASGGRHVRRIRCSGSKLVYQAAALDAVHQCSPMSKSLVTARIRSPGRTLKPAAEVRGGHGVAGPNPVVAIGGSSWSEAVSEQFEVPSFPLVAPSRPPKTAGPR